MKNYRIVIVTKGNAELQESEVREPVGNEVLIRNHYTVVSAGTERAWSQDMNNAHPKFPWYPGYCGSGEVVAIGPDVKNYKVGDKVVVNWAGHALYSIKHDWLFPTNYLNTNAGAGATYNIKQEKIVKIPENVSMLDAAFTNISSFSFNGVRKLHLEIGESCMIAGQGILGVFALQIAALSGAVPMIVSDFSPERRALALKLGADYALNPGDPDYIKQVKDITEGEGVRAIVEVTGSAIALQQALEYAAWEARVSLLGCTRIPDAPIDFYRYVHCRGIQILGAHTMTRAKVESAPYHWTQEDDYRAFLKLLANGKMKASEIISEIVTPDKCHDIYAMLGENKNPPLGIVFDWRNL